MQYQSPMDLFFVGFLANMRLASAAGKACDNFLAEFVPEQQVPPITMLRDVPLGKSHSFETTLSQGDIGAFADISGDRNRIHLDEETAELSRFKRIVAHGMLVKSYWSRLAAELVPGAILYGEDSVRYLRPVYPGDTVKTIGEIVELIPKSVPLARINCQTIVRDQLVVRGSMLIVLP
jgi:3-hydroxybutyryl-CoA dehydratase